MVVAFSLEAQYARDDARVILYDKYLPVLRKAKDPRARAWCLRYPEGYRLNYLLHILAAKKAGIEKISFGGQAVNTLWPAPRFAKLGFLYCDTGHPGAMANYISAVNLAYLLTGKNPVGSPVRKLPLQSWAAKGFAKLPQSNRPDRRELHKDNAHRVKDGMLILSDEEAKVLQEAAMASRHKWGSLLRKNLNDQAAFAQTVAEVARIQGQIDKFEAYGLDPRTVSMLKARFAPPAAPRELTDRKFDSA